jgi:hypothetical protein
MDREVPVYADLKGKPHLVGRLCPILAGNSYSAVVMLSVPE